MRNATQGVPVIVEQDGVDVAVVSAEILRRTLAATVMVSLRVDGTAPCRLAVEDLDLEVTARDLDEACEEMAAMVRACSDAHRESADDCEAMSDNGIGLHMLASLSSREQLTGWLRDLALAVVWTKNLLDNPALQAHRAQPQVPRVRHLRLVSGNGH